MLKIGTLCYVVDSCIASPMTQRAIGKIVEVASAPYEAPDPSYLPGTYYDVLFDGWTFFCRSDKLVPISDPDAWIEEWTDDAIDAPARQAAPKAPTVR
jgi:hypothetical protein